MQSMATTPIDKDVVIANRDKWIIDFRDKSGTEMGSGKKTNAQFLAGEQGDPQELLLHLVSLWQEDCTNIITFCNNNNKDTNSVNAGFIAGQINDMISTMFKMPSILLRTCQRCKYTKINQDDCPINISPIDESKQICCTSFTMR